MSPRTPQHSLRGSKSFGNIADAVRVCLSDLLTASRSHVILACEMCHWGRGSLRSKWKKAG
eukprot:11834-Eustigmatos_ZCMA.PRE.1